MALKGHAPTTLEVLTNIIAAPSLRRSAGTVAAMRHRLLFNLNQQAYPTAIP